MRIVTREVTKGLLALCGIGTSYKQVVVYRLLALPVVAAIAFALEALGV